MKRKIEFRLFILLPLFFLCADTFARAGGGGGEGGGGTAIGLIAWGIYTVIISGILFHKVIRSKKVIAESSKEDLFWDFNKMRSNARKVFFRMQDAWTDRKIASVKDIITPGLYEDYKTQLNLMKKKGEKNILSGINVTDIRIIGCEDYLDDSHDIYVAHIKGEMLDYTIDEKTGRIIKNADQKLERFTDTYHFIRKDKKWLLDYIDNKVSIWDVIRTRNYHQEE